MTYYIDTCLWDIFRVYEIKKVSPPKPRAAALRLVEEAVELALESGASAQDVYASCSGALHNEQEKHPDRPYATEFVGTTESIAAEVADVVLLAAMTAAVAGVTDHDVEMAARRKVSRLIAAAEDGTLHITDDGRFYRRSPGDGVSERKS